MALPQPGPSKRPSEPPKKLILDPITPKTINWFEDQEPKRLRLALFEEAETVADKMLHDLVEGRKPLSSTQLRRYYSEIKALDYRVKSWHLLKLEAPEARFGEILPALKLLRAKVESKRNAKVGRIPKSFAQFMADGIHSVNNVYEFNAFVWFFEAVMGFYIGRNEKS